MRRLHPEIGLLLLGIALFAMLLFKNISYPLLWNRIGVAWKGLPSAA